MRRGVAWALVAVLLVGVAFSGCASSDLVKPGDRAVTYQNYDASKQGKVLLVDLGKKILGLGVAIPDAINAGVAKLDAIFTDIGNNSFQLLKNWGGIEAIPAEDRKPYDPAESEKQRKKSEEEHAETWYYALGSVALTALLAAAKLYGRSLPVVGPVVGWAMDLWGKGIGNGAATNEKIGDGLQQVIDDVKGRLPSVIVDRLKEILPAQIAGKIPSADLEGILDGLLGDMGETVKAEIHARIRSILGDKGLLIANTKLYEGATLA